MNYEVVSGVGLQTGSFPDCHLVSQLIPSPAAGADFSIPVPGTGGIWKVVSVRARFVASAQAANRFIAIQVKDAAGNETYRAALDTAITTGLTVLYSFTPAVQSLVGGITNTKVLDYPLPEGPYLPNFTINSVTTAIDAGDQWSQIAVWWRGYFPDYGEGANE